MTFIDTLADRFDHQTDRRGFLSRIAMWGAAVVAAPSLFVLTPTTAYAAVCGCANQSCDCSSNCCGGYTEFCCTITGENACPPEGVIGGWWKVEDSSFCDGGARYYMDCHSPCGGCGCGSSGVCSGTCNGTECSCGNHDCRNRKAGCIHFRYGNCNNDVRCVGPIICRVVTCTLPWEVDSGCSTASRIDNGTRYHDSPCLHEGSDPIGHVEDVSGLPGEVVVGGWVLDLDSEDYTGVHVYMDGEFAAGTRATIRRADVQRVFGTATDMLGFELRFPAEGGTRRVCAYAINVGPGWNRLIGCYEVRVPSASPRGNLEVVDVAESGVRFKGWAFDPTTGSPSLTIEVRAGSTFLASFVADRPRGDVQNVFGLEDNLCGFDEIVPAVDGEADYCVRVLDHGDDGSDTELGCTTLYLERDPKGWLDGVDVVQDGVRVSGWAYDPDSPDPVAIHVYADTTFIGGGRADKYRPDVGEAMGIDDYHGFDLLADLPDGARTVRVFAINQGPGRNSLMGSWEL